jgi:hypothetical protein
MIAAGIDFQYTFIKNLPLILSALGSKAKKKAEKEEAAE